MCQKTSIYQKTMSIFSSVQSLVLQSIVSKCDCNTENCYRRWPTECIYVVLLLTTESVSHDRPLIDPQANIIKYFFYSVHTSLFLSHKHTHTCTQRERERDGYTALSGEFFVVRHEKDESTCQQKKPGINEWIISPPEPLPTPITCCPRCHYNNTFSNFVGYFSTTLNMFVFPSRFLVSYTVSQKLHFLRKCRVNAI